MRTRPCSTLASSLAFLATLSVSLAAVPARADFAPVTPTFELAWGVNGTAGGMLSSPMGVVTDAYGDVYVTDANNNRVQKFDGLGHYLARWGSTGSGNGQFTNPSGIAVDRTGNVYVVDPGNSRIQKFTSSGVFVTKWGSVGTASGQFNTPVGVAVDATGDVYVTDYQHRVQKFTSSGTFLMQWGAGGAGNGQFNFPAGIAVDASGDVYVADYLNHRVHKFTGTGTYLGQWGVFGTGNGQMNLPYGLGLDAFGNVYVSEAGNHRVQKFDSTGTYVTQWGSQGSATGQFNAPRGVTLDAAGNVYVADMFNNRIQKFSGAGASLSLPSPVLSVNIPIVGTPYGVATDATGALYVTDPLNSKVRKYDGNGVPLTSWGSAGGGAGQFTSPVAVATDATGTVYVASLDNRVQRFTPTGTFDGQWGGPGSGFGQFNGPYGIATDLSGYVYVADQLNNRIQKFTSLGSFVSTWGASGTGPGQFSLPWGIATDPAGNVYVADAGNRVQKFTSTGTFITQWSTSNAGYNSAGVATDAFGDVYVTNRSPIANVQKFHSDGTLVTQWGNAGNGDGQFNPPLGIAVDPAGNIFVADYGNSRVPKFVTPATIAQVSDVGNDQGRQVRVRFRRASLDAAGNGDITSYSIYRRIESPLVPSAAAPTAAAAADLAGWDFVGSQPAGADPEYNVVVPTLADANAASVYYSSYLVRAQTANAAIRYDSAPEYGYSIDNLPPSAPSPFLASYSASATHLHWGPSSAPDFATFRLYRGVSADFTPSAGNLLAATVDTGYVDAGGAGSFYKLSAVDLNGNVSSYALVGPGQTTGVPGGPPPPFALEGVHPNPVTGRSLAVQFTLPQAGAARLELLDVSGRVVARRDVEGAGPHTVDLAEGSSIRPGLYFLRLRQGGNEKERRVTVLD